MARESDVTNMAVFCDFENVALGVRDANYEKFDIQKVLERLLLKGSIVVKKAYCDWDRYKAFKGPMHEASFELIEIPHVRMSGKNSADIRMVVDALDLCYTKAHVDTFVVISGDSDFSPLVSKLRENAKQVIGVGVKQSTSDLLIANCDEFIFYDDLVRESQRAAKKETREAQAAARRSPEEEKRRREELETRKMKAIEFAVQTFDALYAERGDTGKIWASVLKEAMKRRKPDFSESYYGFRAFGNLLEEARTRGLLDFARDEKARTFVYRGAAELARGDALGARPASDSVEVPVDVSAAEAPIEPVATQAVVEEAAPEVRKSRRRRHTESSAQAAGAQAVQPAASEPEAVLAGEAGPVEDADVQARAGAARSPSRKRTRKSSKEVSTAAPDQDKTAAAPMVSEVTEAQPLDVGTREAEAVPAADEAPAKKSRKPSSRSRRPRKQELPPDAA